MDANEGVSPVRSEVCSQKIWTLCGGSIHRDWTVNESSIRKANTPRCQGTRESYAPMRDNMFSTVCAGSRDARDDARLQTGNMATKELTKKTISPVVASLSDATITDGSHRAQDSVTNGTTSSSTRNLFCRGARPDRSCVQAAACAMRRLRFAPRVHLADQC